MNQVVVTGADGFIGRHFVRALVDRGVRVSALVLPDSPLACHIEGLSGVAIVPCDLMDLASVASAVPENADAFVYLAWAGVSPEARDDVR